MSKIQTDGYFSPRTRTGSRRSRAVGQPGGLFSSLLSPADEAEAPEEYRFRLESDPTVESLLDSVHDLGGQLKKDPRRETLLRYKEAVKQLLGFVVKNGIEVRDHVSGHNIMRRKRFSVVTVIDERLERLGAGVLESQRDQIEILRKVDEIYGLLVDLFR